jgi:hypothetical protein
MSKASRKIRREQIARAQELGVALEPSWREANAFPLWVAGVASGLAFSTMATGLLMNSAAFLSLTLLAWVLGFLGVGILELFYPRVFGRYNALERSLYTFDPMDDRVAEHLDSIDDADHRLDAGEILAPLGRKIRHYEELIDATQSRLGLATGLEQEAEFKQLQQYLAHLTDKFNQYCETRDALISADSPDQETDEGPSRIEQLHALINVQEMNERLEKELLESDYALERATAFVNLDESYDQIMQEVQGTGEN